MRLLVVTGPPGAGKSTVARRLADRAPGPGAAGVSARSVLVDGDAFYAFLARGAALPWSPEAHAQNEAVSRASGAAAGRFAAEGYDTVFDGVVGWWFLPTFLAATGLDALDYVVLLPTVEVCLDRVRTRVGHGFDDPAATRQMHRSFAGAGAPARNVLVDPPGDPDGVADAIAAARSAGRLRVDAATTATTENREQS